MAVVHMRETQRRYSAVKSQPALREALRHETIVDTEIERARKFLEPKTEQKELF